MNAVRPGSPAGLREANRRRVLDAVLAEGEPTQSGIAASTGLAPATVSNIVRDLCREGRLTASTTVRGGRRVRAVRLAPVPGVVAGIDFGHRHVRVGIQRAAVTVLPEGEDDGEGEGPGRLLAERSSDLAEGHDAGVGLDVAAALLDEALAAAGVPRPELLAVGIGLPAPVDARTGAVGEPGILPGWVGIRPAAVAGERFGAPVVVDNDALLGTLAERAWGALREVDDGVYLKLSDGVGAGLVLGGRPYRGRTGTAGELGHVVVDDSGGPPGGAVCRCGNRGCLETWASTATVVGLLEPLLGAPLTVEEVVARARGGHAPSRRVLADTGEHVGRALGGLCSVLTPARIVVGGELAQAEDLLLDPLRAALERWALPGAVDGVEVTTARLGRHAHVLGAVALALEHVLAAHG
ncbi:ROK family transcriptional regulator [Actinomycetospora corticicola]|uniref:Putative NBD/HSP70 family sugar kinase n=1 Tax=Actinomycetospora corticicola TaxID=663602 RepID=A0A7Y9DV59_9PSEU|nr:ROK family protein [Actinomycetospora corticicola]NYD35984.1 putative NBD/HSP70 family sugar kinase [Actinomycetospora corticicola]